MIVNPDGEIVAVLDGEEDGVLVHPCDLDDTRFGKETIFDFKRHRRIEHYGPITGAGRRGRAGVSGAAGFTVAFAGSSQAAIRARTTASTCAAAAMPTGWPSARA